MCHFMSVVHVPFDVGVCLYLGSMIRRSGLMDGVARGAQWTSDRFCHVTGSGYSSVYGLLIGSE